VKEREEQREEAACKFTNSFNVKIKKIYERNRYIVY
jgi:hypothetical protein